MKIDKTHYRRESGNNLTSQRNLVPIRFANELYLNQRFDHTWTCERSCEWWMVEAEEIVRRMPMRARIVRVGGPFASAWEQHRE